MIATRGCHDRCGFCYLATDSLHVPYQMKDADQVAEEIRTSGEPYAVVLDNNLGSRPGCLRQLCEALRPLEIIWSAAVTADVTDDPGVVRQMALSGCTGVFVGFETLVEANLVAARKRSPAPDDFARRVRVFHDYGIQVNGSFVLGFDGDGAEVFDDTLRWIEDTRLECATFHILTAYLAGSCLYKRSNRLGSFLTRHSLTHRVWSPLVELSRRRHLRFRTRLGAATWAVPGSRAPETS